MNLHKVVSTLTIAAILVLPLAGLTGCTGPLRGSGNNANTTQFGEFEEFPYSEDSPNTTS